MVGWLDYEESKFNRATQALRQVGSSFKPYVYTAAVDTAGATPYEMILDAPTSFITGSGVYTPHNYDVKFEATVTLPHALAESFTIPAWKSAESMARRGGSEVAPRTACTMVGLAYFLLRLPGGCGAVSTKRKSWARKKPVRRQRCPSG